MRWSGKGRAIRVIVDLQPLARHEMKKKIYAISRGGEKTSHLLRARIIGLHR